MSILSNIFGKNKQTRRTVNDVKQMIKQDHYDITLETRRSEVIAYLDFWRIEYAKEMSECVYAFEYALSDDETAQFEDFSIAAKRASELMDLVSSTVKAIYAVRGMKKDEFKRWIKHMDYIVNRSKLSPNSEPVLLPEIYDLIGA
jgi:hypothetical protein